MAIKIVAAVRNFKTAIWFFRDDYVRHIRVMKGAPGGTIHVCWRDTISHLDVTYVIQKCAAGKKNVLGDNDQQLSVKFSNTTRVRLTANYRKKATAGAGSSRTGDAYYCRSYSVGEALVRRLPKQTLFSASTKLRAVRQTHQRTFARL